MYELNMYEQEQVLDHYQTLLATEKETNARLVKEILCPLQGYVRILDIGCGLAPLLPPLIEQLRVMDPNVKIVYLGIDNSESMVKHARMIHYHLIDAKTDIQFQQGDVTTLNEQSQFAWYNIILCQSLIHLLEEKQVLELFKFISKALINVFYVSTKIDVDIAQVKEDRIIAKKGDQCYTRRLYTRESFEQALEPFRQEGTYDLETSIQVDSQSRRFLVAKGIKSQVDLYQRYHYALGYEPALLRLKEDMVKCNTLDYVHDLQEMKIIRREGFLLDLYYRDHDRFLDWMNLFQTLVSRVKPGQHVMYLKDKLNLNQRGWGFPLHQDASTGWNERLAKYLQNPNFVTIGIALASVETIDQGPTRIGIRQGCLKEVIPETQNNIVDSKALDQRLGKPLQYLCCYGIPGSYYLFDQYVLHDSAFNLQEQSRDVFFITLALTDAPALDSVLLAEQFYKSKGALDKKTIEQLLQQGYKIEDFSRDRFGKFTLIEHTL